MKKLLLLLVLSVAVVSSFAQNMNEMIVVRQAERRQDQLIDQSRVDRSGRLCAALIILTDLTGLTFESNLGIVDRTYNPGRYMLFFSEGERVIDIYKEGFRPLEIILSQYGIYGLKAGEVYQLEVTAKDRDESNVQSVVFNVTPEDALIRVGSLTFTTGRPQPLPIGENEVVIEKEGYRPVRESIFVDSNNIMFNYQLEEIDMELVKFRTEPQSATIHIDTAQRGITNRDLWLYPGRYDVQLTLPSYLTINEAIEIREGVDNTFQWTLTKNVGSIILEVLPVDAEVLINNQRIEHTVTQELTPGTYEILVRADRHLNISETVELGLGEMLNKRYILSGNTGTLNVSIDPTGAELFINNEEFPYSEEIELTPGLYRLEAKAEGHRPVTDRIEITLGETISRSYRLEPMTGTLLLEVFPTNAEIEIVFQGQVQQRVIGSSRVNDLLAGGYVLRAKADGYKTKEYSINISENETLHQSIVLEEGVDKSSFEHQPITILPGELVFINGGTFQMGSNNSSRNERPVHTVRIDDFYIGRYPVTQKEFTAVMGHNPSNFSGELHPVESVSWYEAVSYCNLLSIKEGFEPVYIIDESIPDRNNDSPNDQRKWTVTIEENANGYRLPTEAEWEYAARSGINSSDQESSSFMHFGLDDFAWYRENSQSTTHPVGRKAPNRFGLYDMVGNVFEWCWDWYGGYSGDSKVNSTGAYKGSFRVRRGGSWKSAGTNCRVSYRISYYNHSFTYDDIGFRVARNAN